MRSGGEISSDPMVNFVHRRMPALLLAALASLIIYCSLVPFDFGEPQWRDARQQTVLGLSIRAFNLPDIMVNIALYIPLAAGVFTVARHGGRGRLSAFVAATLSPILLSFLIEETQAWEHSRVAAWADVVANSLGALMGTLIAASAEAPLRRILATERQKAARNWWLSFSKVLACFVVLVQLRPYDLVTEPKVAAKNLLRHADMSPLARWRAIPSEVDLENRTGRSDVASLRRAQWEYLLDRAVEAALFAALAATTFAGLCRDGASAGSAALGAALTGHTLAAAIMFIRVLLVSRGFDSSILPCATIGWLIGLFAGGHALRRFNTNTGPFVWPRTWHWVTTAAALALLELYGLVPFEFRTPANLHDIAWRVGFVPFKGVMASRFNDAFMAVSGDLLKFAALGAVVAALSNSQIPLRVVLPRCAAVALAFAAATEMVHLLMPSRHCDVTHVIIALVGSLTGAAVLRWLVALRGSISQVRTDDLLTAQLIEGPSYQPIEVKAPPAARSDASPTGPAESRLLP